ncbi:MAG TPA: amidohydrolase family protein [Pyrinomonadaceae bacterium]
MAKISSRMWLSCVFAGAILYTLLLQPLPASEKVGHAQDRATPASTRQEGVVERGKFRLHKLQQPIGEESYEVRREGGGSALQLRSTFEVTDRMTKVALSATLSARQDLTPERFEIKGKTSRSSEIDASVEIQGREAKVRRGKESGRMAVPERFFTIDGYAPFSVQMMLLRYWVSHNIKGALKTLPGGGEVMIEHRGRDALEVGGKRIDLERYSASGVIWGRETLWLDSSKQLVAAVTNDAEFDHFEAIREGYESLLPVFVAKALQDRMDALVRLANQVPPTHKGTLAITGGKLIDGTGKAAMQDAVVVIEGERITAAGPRTEIKIPKGATIIDARGQTLLPGLWDMHAHYEQVEWGPVYLAAGVTTVRDVGNEFEFITAVRDLLKQGRGLGPDIVLAGLVDGDGPAAFGTLRANTTEEGRSLVNRYHKAGFEQIKIYSSVKPEVVAAITSEAHRLGMTVTGHIPIEMIATEAVEAGMDQINHISFLPPVMLPQDAIPEPGKPPQMVNIESAEAKQAIQFFKKHGTVIDPTIALKELDLHPVDTPATTFEPGAAKVARELSAQLNSRGKPTADAPITRAIFEQYLVIIGALHRAGVPLVAGTDQTVPGHSLHREIELYVRAGLTPMEAIQAATITPARVLKIDKEVGTIEAGKRADLIILDGDPLESISNIRKVRRVVKRGRVYDCAQLWQSVGFRP